MPAPALYGQFHNLSDVNIVLQALLDLGFDEVFEPSAVEDLISDLTLRELDDEGRERPVISSACPVVVRLISQKFPNLIPNISKYLSPPELAAKLARERARIKTGLDDKDIGVFFVSSCPANVTEAHYPLGLKEPVIDYVLSMTDVYKRLLSLMDGTKKHDYLRTPPVGDGRPYKDYNVISCNGLSDVIKLLDAVEGEQLPDVDYLELFSCVPGCCGGCMTVENPFAAKARLMKLTAADKTGGTGMEPPLCPAGHLPALRTEQIEYAPTGILDADFKTALGKMKRVEDLNNRLPGLDCGSCGSPGCRELALDVVMGYADETDCVFNARAMMEDGGDANSYLPPPFRKSANPP